MDRGFLLSAVHIRIIMSKNLVTQTPIALDHSGENSSLALSSETGLDALAFNPAFCSDISSRLPQQRVTSDELVKEP